MYIIRTPAFLYEEASPTANLWVLRCGIELRVKRQHPLCEVICKNERIYLLTIREKNQHFFCAPISMLCPGNFKGAINCERTKLLLHWSSAPPLTTSRGGGRYYTKHCLGAIALCHRNQPYDVSLTWKQMILKKLYWLANVHKTRKKKKRGTEKRERKTHL